MGYSKEDGAPTPLALSITKFSFTTACSVLPDSLHGAVMQSAEAAARLFDAGGERALVREPSERWT